MGKHGGNQGGIDKKHTAEEVADKLLAFLEKEDDPRLSKFAKDYYISEDTVERLAKENSRICGIIKIIFSKQREYIIENVQNGKIAPPWGIFRMKQPVHGWTDKQDINAYIESQNKIDMSELSNEQLQNIIDKMSKK